MERNNTDLNQISVYIADNCEADMKRLRQHFLASDKFKVIGSSTDALQMMKELKRNMPDVIIMDVVLSGMDGFEFMEIAKEDFRKKMPKIIITSALSHQGFVEKAITAGASYFMVKPIKPDVLEHRIIDVMNVNPYSKTFKNNETKALDEKISNVFLSVGIPAHIKGYQFLREAIKMATQKPELISSITKELYPTIALRFQTTASKVERAIRHAIEVAWNRGKIENINNLFGVQVYAQNEKPTNGEFIALVADKMLMEGF